MLENFKQFKSGRWQVQPPSENKPRNMPDMPDPGEGVNVYRNGKGVGFLVFADKAKKKLKLISIKGDDLLKGLTFKSPQEFIDQIKSVLNESADGFELSDNEIKKLNENLGDKTLSKVDISEALDKLFEGKNLAEEFITEAKAAFEAAVDAAAEAKVAEKLDEAVTAVVDEKVEAALAEKLEEAKAEQYKTISENVDTYATHVAEKWLSENKEVVKSNLRLELAEDFIEKLHGVFAESYITVPEDKEDIVEGLVEDKEKAEKALEESTDEVISLKAQLAEAQKVVAVHESATDLTMTQREQLVEAVKADKSEDVGAFITEYIAENFNETPAAPELNEDEVPLDLAEETVSSTNPEMAAILDKLNAASL